jgi:hypothetical protein
VRRTPYPTSPVAPVSIIFITLAKVIIFETSGVYYFLKNCDNNVANTSLRQD